MAVISITIPDASLTRVVNGMATTYSYQAQIPDPANPGQLKPNPETKNAFAKRMLIEILKNAVKVAEGQAAADTARQNVDTDVDTINLT